MSSEPTQSENTCAEPAHSESENASPLFEWTLRAVNDLKLTKEPAAEKMCRRFESFVREFVKGLQNKESQERVQLTVPPSIMQTGTKIIPRIISTFRQHKADSKKPQETQATTGKRQRREKKKKNPSKVIQKSVKKIISAFKSVRRSEWDAFIKQVCAETKFNTAEAAIKECQDILNEANITVSDLQKKLRAKVVHLLRGKGGGQSSIVSTITSFVGNSVSGNKATGGLNTLFNIAQTMLTTNEKTSSRTNSKRSSNEPKGIMATLLRGFIRSKQTT